MKAVNFEWKMDFAISWNDRNKIYTNPYTRAMGWWYYSLQHWNWSYL